MLARHLFFTDASRFPRWLHVCLPPQIPPEIEHLSGLQPQLHELSQQLAEMARRQQRAEEATQKRLEELRRACIQ